MERPANRFHVLDLGSLIRFGIVGAVQNGIFYLLALLLIHHGYEAWQAFLFLSPIAVCLTFLANKRWSFGQRRHSLIGRSQFWRYVLLYGVTYIVAASVTWAQERSGIPSWLAMLLTIVLAAGALYLALNYWVFRGNSADMETAGRRSAR